MKATEALAKAPGRLTVVDAQTIYFRPPAVFIEPEPLLLTLRNLLMKAYEAEGGASDDPATGDRKDAKAQRESKAAERV
jgi:hypothetical protein